MKQASAPHSSAPKNILIIKLGALGDFVQSLGPIAAIRRHHPDARITLLTTKPFRDFAAASGYIDNIRIDTRPKFFDIPDLLELRRFLHSGFTHIYDLQNNDRTQLYLYLAKGSGALWTGAGRGADIRNASSERTARTGFDGHVHTLGLAGISGVVIDPMDWIVSQKTFDSLRAPYILLVTGSAPGRPEKRWPVQHYTALAIQLAAQGFQPVLIGTDAEKNINAEIAQNCTEALELTGLTNLFDIVALARGAYGAIGNDTGPMHMIAPVGIPTLVLFSGHSNPARHAPVGYNVLTLQQNDLPELSPEKVLKAFYAQTATSVA